MSVAVISSLYHCEPHLPTFTAAVFGFAKQVSQSGISVHYLPIVNDASDYEREQIDLLTREINANYFGRMTPLFVPRESLYASWNRGIASSQTPFIAFWNVDDIRSAEGFIEGFRALQDGANLVDFPFTRVSTLRRLAIFLRQQRLDVPMLFDPSNFARGNGLGPFFMASRTLYQRVGAFDEAFRVAGDMEWAGRALPHVRFHAGRQNGGDFLIHGDNLSNSGSDREDIEVNTIFCVEVNGVICVRHIRARRWMPGTVGAISRASRCPAPLKIFFGVPPPTSAGDNTNVSANRDPYNAAYDSPWRRAD